MRSAAKEAAQAFALAAALRALAARGGGLPPPLPALERGHSPRRIFEERGSWVGQCLGRLPLVGVAA